MRAKRSIQKAETSLWTADFKKVSAFLTNNGIDFKEELHLYISNIVGKDIDILNLWNSLDE